MMALAHLGTVVCMLMHCLRGSQPRALAAHFRFQVLIGASSAGVYAMRQILAGPTASARWVGIQNCCGNVAGVIAPALTGFLVQDTGHYELAFVAAAVISALGHRRVGVDGAQARAARWPSPRVTARPARPPPACGRPSCHGSAQGALSHLQLDERAPRVRGISSVAELF